MRQINNKRQTKRLPELLAPAGSFAHLKAAVKAGADAVYMGGQRFGARAYADNFSRDDLVEALHYAHFYDTRLYLTVNTLMKERELEGKKVRENEERLYDFLYPFYREGLDGVIVQDIGAASLIRTHFPEMELHGSTQMTITDVYGARAAARMGMTRIVPARELSLQELQAIKEATGLELEVFIHGALCYCYSGQCLLSSVYGGRSGNRGRCAQPCRLPYRLYRTQEKKDDVLARIDLERENLSDRLHRKQEKDGVQTGLKKANLSYRENGQKFQEMTDIHGQHLLSPKDLCTMERLPELIAAGVDSLKIEGRMKNVEYVAGVTAMYRKYLDAYVQDFAEEDSISVQKDIRLLEELYSREGFTEGYWTQHNGKNMMAVHYPRNLGRKLGNIVTCMDYQISVRLDKGETLHPKDILIVPLEKKTRDSRQGSLQTERNNETNELVLTVPEKVKQQKNLVLLNIPKTKGLRKGMSVYRRKNEELSQWIQKEILEREIKYPVSGMMRIQVGQPVQLVLQCRGEEIHVSGEIVQLSKNRPVTKEDILRQMNKTGDTPFFLEDFEVELDSNAFLPMSQVKAMRQEAFELLKNTEENTEKDTKNFLQFPEKNDSVILPNNIKNYESEKQEELIEELPEICKQESFPGNHGLHHKMAVIYDEKTLKYCLADSFFDSICLPYDFWQDVVQDDWKNDQKTDFKTALKNDEKEDGLLLIARVICNHGKKVYLSLPEVFRSYGRTGSGLEKLRKICQWPFWSGIYTNNLGEAEFLRELEIPESDEDKTAKSKTPILASASFYHWNHWAIDTTRDLFGFAAVELPHELSQKECVDLLEGEKCRVVTGSNSYPCNLEWTVYGRFPVMRSAQCVKKTAGLCDARPEILWLEDTKGRRLPVATHCDSCFNTIWRDQPVNRIGGNLGELREYIHTFRFHFMETEIQEIESVVRDFQRWEEHHFASIPSRNDSSAYDKKMDAHWLRGVE